MTENGRVRLRQVPAVTRAIAILRRLGKSPEPLGVNRLARELGLVPSTCLHILRVLTEEGLVAVDEQTKRYSVGIGILPIARSAIQRNTFASPIEPRLTDLSQTFGGTIVATQLDDADHMIVVALSRARQPFQLQVDLGSRFPVLISATGRCHAAFNLRDLTAKKLKDSFAALQWDQPPAYQVWKSDIEQARIDGFAVDRGCYISGVTIIAIPFLDRNGRMTHSIVAIDISERIEEIGISALARSMLDVRDSVREHLFDMTA